MATNGKAVDPAAKAGAGLVPGVRDRLIARLVALGLPTDKRASFLAGLTGCAPQTVRRWLADSDPGLPDLKSFSTLCRELHLGANELVGLTSQSGQDVEHRLLIDVARCVHDMAESLQRPGRKSEPVVVPGDEMAPRLREGDLAFVDRGSGFVGNGLYAFECRGEVVIRRAERRSGHGWLLKCDNRAYSDNEFSEFASASRRGLRLLGKVRGTIALRVY
ncbi:MAG: S24 family peptidase [Burkholderiales bacterium]|nr:S24 family peptidase [Burkholderiales bacterium]